MTNFEEYLFRASQSSKIATGSIGLTNTQKARVIELKNEKETGINANGNKVKWTENKKQELSKYLDIDDKQEFPKTMKSELKKIFRAEKYNRNFVFTNKYVQKGIQQEEEGVTTYQEYRNKILGIRTFFKTDIGTKIRLYNEYFSGEPDLVDTNDFNNCNEGFDIKCSWNLETFPLAEEPLDPTYFSQNQVYMSLTKCDKWTTAYVLVNATEQMVFNEKMKHFYALNQPANEDDKNYKEYISKCRDIEKMMIFDYDRFVNCYPGHILEYTREEWYGEDLDIPLKARVIEKTVYRDQEYIDFLKERVKLSRKYLVKLNEA